MSEPSTSKCPVDHASLTTPGADKCPVDHSSSSWSSWRAFLPGSSHPSPPNPPARPPLSTARETSSIPRTDGQHWEYPSEAQFFAAMARKQHDPHAADMAAIVPIHNAVNERAWAEVLRWEAGQGSGEAKLVSFKGRPGDLTPRARWRALIGYSKPFDRHDWIVDRSGTRIRYVIDFYTGRAQGPSAAPSFYLDVRPALDSWEGVRMRVAGFWGRWLGFGQSSSGTSLETKS
ncbi:cytochrome c and c1 heme-lyase [Neolentinus lepideus HHB14362 ss-1]|uniref:Holocytochrome c-type synthase n=1 Tax=Neolentinus lepideus HHB14362 ss-1 TaxID=1314782 RepID=A0A165TD40_9AGAM|nr:cytochrome c and c1 heme-lyase [Neolentinus lepideus HHB14362 ss-1]